LNQVRTVFEKEYDVYVFAEYPNFSVDTPELAISNPKLFKLLQFIDTSYMEVYAVYTETKKTVCYVKKRLAAEKLFGEDDFQQGPISFNGIKVANLNLIFNYFVRQAQTSETFKKYTQAISRVRTKYPNDKMLLVGDFNLRCTSTRNGHFTMNLKSSWSHANDLFKILDKRGIKALFMKPHAGKTHTDLVLSTTERVNIKPDETISSDVIHTGYVITADLQ
jgi:hypothetical protein